MPQKSHIKAEFRHLLAFFLCLGFFSVQAQENPSPAHFGRWVINAELSDNTDKKVGSALRAMGEKSVAAGSDAKKIDSEGGQRSRNSMTVSPMTRH